MIFAYNVFADDATPPPPAAPSPTAPPDNNTAEFNQLIQQSQTQEKGKEAQAQDKKTPEEKKTQDLKTVLDNVTPDQISETQIKDLKQKAMEYHKVIVSPPKDHPGQTRTVPYQPAPINISSAVGYATVIQSPFQIRKTNGVVIGDKGAFDVNVLDDYNVAIFPKKSFWPSNIEIFSTAQNDFPILLHVQEETDLTTTDYLVRIEDVRNMTKMDSNTLMGIALQNSFPGLGYNSLRNLKCEKNDTNGLIKKCTMDNPAYVVLVFKGQMECLVGCDTYGLLFRI